MKDIESLLLLNLLFKVNVLLHRNVIYFPFESKAVQGVDIYVLTVNPIKMTSGKGPLPCETVFKATCMLVTPPPTSRLPLVGATNCILRCAG